VVKLGHSNPYRTEISMKKPLFERVVLTDDEKERRAYGRKSLSFTLHIPESWLQLLLTLSYYGFRTALMCWRGHSLAKGGWFTIPSAVRRTYGIEHRTHLHRALRELSSHGLIEICKDGRKMSTGIKVLRPDLRPPEEKSPVKGSVRKKKTHIRLVK
jgi:hypothetical protein